MNDPVARTADVPAETPAEPPWDSARYLREILRAPVYEAAEHTPLQPMRTLSARLGCAVAVKREDLQTVHSFKIRGAYNAMRALGEAERARGVITASAGNHAQGVARSATLLGVDATIVMPTVTPRIKVDAVRRVGRETFRLCSALLDDVVTVSSDQVSAAVRDIFEDVRAVPEPSGALALAGLKIYAAEHKIVGERLACVLSGANLNFHQLRYICERSELGEQREAILGVTIPEVQGEFLRFASVLGGRSVTEFNYRLAAAGPSGAPARIFVGVRLTRGRRERAEIVADLEAAGYGVIDLTDDELAKVHVRSMVGGRAPAGLTERLFSFEFPESPGALMRFLEILGTRWNITLFHYRTDGADYGRILTAFEVGGDPADSTLTEHMDRLGYAYREETDDPSARFFLAD